jgi:hypothetical protein
MGDHAAGIAAIQVGKDLFRGLLSSKTKAAANPRDRYGFVVMYRLSLTKNLPGASWTPVKQWTREIRHGLHAETLPKLVRKRNGQTTCMPLTSARTMPCIQD